MSNTTLIRSFARENLLNHQGICMKSTYNYLLHLLRFIHIVFIGLHLICRHWPSMYCTIQDRTLIGLFLISFHGECLYLCYNLIISQSYQFISLVKGFFFLSLLETILSPVVNFLSFLYTLKKALLRVETQKTFIILQRWAFSKFVESYIKKKALVGKVRNGTKT